MNFRQIFERALGLAPRMHPVERGLARHWTKQRLAAVFPELRGDARGLEAAYRALDLQPTSSAAHPSEVVFEIALHREFDG